MTFKQTIQRIVDNHQYMRYKNVTIDAFTAQHILEVINNLSPKNQASVEKMVKTQEGFNKFLAFVWSRF